MTESSRTELTIVRHGHTCANAPGADVPMSGITNVPLGPRGTAEARRLAAALAERGPFKRIYSSHLERAFETARIIAERCGLQIRSVPGLAEINCGLADGLALSEVQRRYPEEWRRNLMQSDPDFRWPQGESYREFRERVVQAMHAIVGESAGERVLVVTHSGVISQLLGWIRGLSPGCWGRFRPRTGSLTELVWNDQRVLVRRYDHLPRTRHE